MKYVRTVASVVLAYLGVLGIFHWVNSDGKLMFEIPQNK